MIKLYKPTLDELWFREKFMNDKDTMSYNHAWGGTIPFPKEKWQKWYDKWIVNHENKRFYRYLLDEETGNFVGETAYHYDEERKIYIADVIVAAQYRGKGYGKAGLKLLCDSAEENGLKFLYDDIAIDNKAINLFLKSGFKEEYRTDIFIMLKKEL